MPRSLDCFAVCAPGLEATLRDELGRGRAATGGVSFGATTRELYAANMWLRTATRVLLRVARFRARSFGELERAAGDVDWDRWLAADAEPEFRVSSSASRLYHTGAVAERLARVSGRTPGKDQLFVVRIRNDQVTLSVDSSGEPLHRRGWRLATAKAPVRETLAAAMLLAAPWTGTEPLLDPLCGSGTIPIEAALIANRVAPGHARRFRFQDWPSFEPGTWASVVEEASQARRRQPVRISGSDRDAGAIEAAVANAERAGVADAIELTRASLSEASGVGWLISNPPYGARVGGKSDLRNLYARLGQVAANQRIGLLVADLALANHTGIEVRERFRTANGGIRVCFVVGV